VVFLVEMTVREDLAARLSALEWPGHLGRQCNYKLLSVKYLWKQRTYLAPARTWIIGPSYRVPQQLVSLFAVRGLPPSILQPMCELPVTDHGVRHSATPDSAWQHWLRHRAVALRPCHSRCGGSTSISSGGIQTTRPFFQAAIGLPSCLCRSTASRTARPMPRR